MFDYNAAAELFPRRGGKSGTKIGYRRFATAADAIQFAIEVLPSTLLVGTYLESNDERLGAEQILDLYHDDDFPLPRSGKPALIRSKA